MTRKAGLFLLAAAACLFVALRWVAGPDREPRTTSRIASSEGDTRQLHNPWPGLRQNDAWMRGAGARRARLQGGLAAPGVDDAARRFAETQPTPVRDDGNGDEQKIKELVAQATSAQDPDDRADALDDLATSEWNVAAPLVAGALSDSSPEVRITAVQALSNWQGDSAPVSLLSQALQDPDAQVRLAALDVMNEMDEDFAQELLPLAQTMLRDRNPDVRSDAEDLLMSLGKYDETSFGNN